MFFGAFLYSSPCGREHPGALLLGRLLMAALISDLVMGAVMLYGMKLWGGCGVKSGVDVSVGFHSWFQRAVCCCFSFVESSSGMRIFFLSLLFWYVRVSSCSPFLPLSLYNAAQSAIACVRLFLLLLSLMARSISLRLVMRLVVFLWLRILIIFVGDL